MNLSQGEQAIISLPTKKGLGVLIPGNMILTAAHCISCTCSSRMALLEDNPIKVKIKDQLVLLNILFVDPVSDIAVLGNLTSQDYRNNTFTDFCNRTRPFKINRPKFIPWETIPLKIYNTNKQWVNATGQVSSVDSHIILLETDATIKFGASGGPIVNENLELISINSTVSTRDRNNTGSSPLPLLTLPKWILQSIKA